MTVYIVMTGERKEGGSILAVLSSEEKAIALLKQCFAKEQDRWLDKVAIFEPRWIDWAKGHRFESGCDWWQYHSYEVM